MMNKEPENKTTVIMDNETQKAIESLTGHVQSLMDALFLLRQEVEKLKQELRTTTPTVYGPSAYNPPYRHHWTQDAPPDVIAGNIKRKKNE